MKKGIIDRFEGLYAVVEMDEGFKNIKRELLPNNAKEGDVIIINDNGIRISKDETIKRRSRIRKLMEGLFK